MAASGTVLAVLAVLALPVIALAHTMLKSSDPADGARLTTVPRAIRLSFTESPALAFTRVELRNSNGRAVVTEAVRYAPDSKRSVVIGVRGPLDVGEYVVVWQTAGDDGHPTRGRFRFTILSGASGAGPMPSGEAGAAVTAPGQSHPPSAHHVIAPMPESGSFGAESLVYAAIRWLQFTTLVVIIATVAFRFVVLGFMGRERGPRTALIDSAAQGAARIGVVAAMGLVVATLLRLAAQSVAMHGASDAWHLSFVGTMLRDTVWGWAWLLQLLGVIVVVVGFARARRPSTGAAAWSLAALGAAVLAFTPALSGHAVSAPRLMILAVLADGVHVIGASGWLGSLVLVVMAGIPAALRLPAGERGEAVADLVNAFSPTALTFAGMTATTGVFAAWLHLGTVSALWESTYGKTLLVKLAVLSIVAATGAYNWLRVRPALGNVEGVRRVRRSASVELAVGLIVLAITAVLVATPTAVDMSAMRASVTHASDR
ncbi:MAG: copper resistance protein CopC/CopD [Gemmatimonadota bacterium]|nr:copper resistance protein CopC/CopD [Gemmatimonadota bacterium]